MLVDVSTCIVDELVDDVGTSEELVAYSVVIKEDGLLEVEVGKLEVVVIVISQRSPAYPLIQ